MHLSFSVSWSTLKHFAARTLLLAGMFFPLAALAAPPAAATASGGPLVSPAWLKARIDQPNLLLLDASAPPLFAKGHIPGAVNASILSQGMQDATPDRLEARYRAWGVRDDAMVVIYEQNGDEGPMWAPHLFHDLYYLGFPADRLFLLDGGLERWRAEGGAVTQVNAPPRSAGNFRIGPVREQVRARLADVLQATGEPGRIRLVEALEPDWHYGNTAFFTRGGHIPHAAMLPARDFYNADGTFKTAAEITRMLDYRGVRPDQPVITYCGGGVAATVPFFALRFLLGRENVSVFRESQVGWLQDERGLPVWTWSAPERLRDAQWARTWGGAMMRTYRNAKVDFIDVRSPAEFEFRRPRFAINVPAARVREHWGDAPALRALFAQAGVQPGHEAVVMAGPGVTPDAALVAFALEWVGQGKVSLLAEGIEAAARKGLAMVDAATPGRPAAAPASATPANSGPASPVTALRTAMRFDPASPVAGVFPKVYITAGAAAPASETEGTPRIRLQPAELLQPDGQLKSAGEVWKQFAKAGVPRYAEIIIVADDPGAAALAWQIFKLMGYPDVKVWAG